jgi:hypothetical protein
MMRIRLSTSLLLVVIAALATALVSQELRHRQRESEQKAEFVAEIENQRINYLNELKEKEAKLAETLRRLGVERIIVD